MLIDLIVNAQARRYAREPQLLERVCAAAAGRARLHVTRDLAELQEECDALARRGTELLVLSGGDGTLMAGVTALRRSLGRRPLPPVAPITGGTVGTVARNWGVAGDPVSCLHRLLQQPRVSRPRPSLRIRARGPDGAIQERIGFIVGSGLVAQFFELYYQRGAPGVAGAARIVARIFAESFVGGPVARQVLTPLPCRLEVDGLPQRPGAWSLICAAVVPDLGMHMRVNYRAAEDPSRPHLVASPLSPRALGPRAPLVLSGRPIGGREHVDQLASAFAVEFSPSGPYVLDGELLRATRLEVSAGPILQVVTPA